MLDIVSAGCHRLLLSSNHAKPHIERAWQVKESIYLLQAWTLAKEASIVSSSFQTLLCNQYTAGCILYCCCPNRQGSRDKQGTHVGERMYGTTVANAKRGTFAGRLPLCRHYNECIHSLSISTEKDETRYRVEGVYRSRMSLVVGRWSKALPEV
jgi:hypothetical protein